MAEPLYYIRSIKHDQHRPKGDEAAMWWRPNGAGYTSSLADAGKYTLSEAKSTCDENQEIRFEGKGRKEHQYPDNLMVPVEIADGLARSVVNKFSLESAMRRMGNGAPEPQVQA